MLLQLVVHFPEPRVGKDLVALMVNLAAHARAAEAGFDLTKNVLSVGLSRFMSISCTRPRFSARKCC